MFRQSTKRVGSYILYDRVVCDWLRFHHREEQHMHAKDTYEKIATENRTKSSMPLPEAEGLIKEFTYYHNVDALSDTIKFIREVHGVELEPHHYVALLRVFVYNKDRDNVVQLLDVIFSRGMMCSQTYASCIDALHTLGGQKELNSILKVVEMVTQQHKEQTGTMFANNLLFKGLENSSSRASPVLSSVLHHVCVSRYNPMAMVIVVTWMRALGVELTMWDYTNVLSMMFGRSAEWPAFRYHFGFFEGMKNGHVTFALIHERCEEYLKSASTPEVEKIGIRELLDAAESSLAILEVDPHVHLDVGVANLGVTNLHTHIDRVVEHATRFKGVGAERENHATLYHARMLMHHYLRQHTEAVRTLETAVKAQRQWKRKYGEDEPTEGPDGEKIYPKPKYSKALEPDDDIARSEPFTFSPHFLLDAGMSFDDVSNQTLKNCSSAFRTIVEQVKHDDKNMRYLAATGMILLQDKKEWKEARREMIKAVKQSSSGRPPAATKHQIKNYINMCGRHPPKNPKMTKRAAEQREKWRSYLEARETALALFGSGNTAREAMKKLFYEGNVQSRARSDKEIERDRQAFKNMFPMFDGATAKKDYPTPFMTEADQNASGVSLDRLVEQLENESYEEPPLLTSSGEEATAVKADKELATERQRGFKRMYNRILKMPSDAIPAHLHNADPNPFPLVNVKQGVDIMRIKHQKHTATKGAAANAVVEGAKGDEDDDPFVPMWEFLRTGYDNWYLTMEDMYAVVARCLIHRLDWEGLVQLTMNTGKTYEFNFAMDMEVNKAFAEAGDPCGALPFKIAAKLFDGRISDVAGAKKHLSTPNTRREKKGFSAAAM